MKKVSINWKPFLFVYKKDSLHLLLPEINQIISSSYRVTRKTGIKIRILILKVYFMKKVLLLLILCATIFSSCAVLPTPISVVNVIDYSVFTQKGIFATESNSVNFDYEAIGSVLSEEIDGWVKKSSLKNEGKQPRKIYQDEYYGDSQSVSFGKRVFVPADLNNALQNFAVQLKKMRANGVINLKISYIKVPYGKTSLNSIVVTGMAIKK